MIGKCVFLVTAHSYSAEARGGCTVTVWPWGGGTLGRMEWHSCNLPSQLLFHSLAANTHCCTGNMENSSLEPSSMTVWLDSASPLQEDNAFNLERIESSWKDHTLAPNWWTKDSCLLQIVASVPGCIRHHLRIMSCYIPIFSIILLLWLIYKFVSKHSSS